MNRRLILKRSHSVDLIMALWDYETRHHIQPSATLEIENGMQEPLAILKAVFNRRMNVENN